jgi:outer membrane protein assembly factor BamB
VLVCAGYEATVAVGAADGGELWRLEGGQHPGAPHLLPPRIVGDTVLVPGADALTAVELTSGKAQWEVPTEGERGLLGLAVAEGVLYTAHRGEGRGRLTVRARALEEDRAELWSVQSVRYDPPGEHVNATRLVVAGDHLYLLLVGGTIAEEQLLSLDARTGAEGGRADCGDVLALPHAVVCRSPHYAMPEFVEVREPGTLALRWGVEVERTVPRFTVDDDDTLMLDPDGMSLVGYDLADGYVRWRREVGDHRNDDLDSLDGPTDRRGRRGAGDLRLDLGQLGCVTNAEGGRM